MSLLARMSDYCISKAWATKACSINPKALDSPCCTEGHATNVKIHMFDASAMSCVRVPAQVTLSQVTLPQVTVSHDDCRCGQNQGYMGFEDPQAFVMNGNLVAPQQVNHT